MDFFTAGCRQREGALPSFLLQQYQCGGTQVVFACLCGEGNGGRAGTYMTERLLSWFRRINLMALSGAKERGVEGVGRALEGLLADIDEELENGGIVQRGRTGFSVLFCVGAFYVLLYRGDGGVRLINRAFGRTCMRALEGEKGKGKLRRIQGVMQPCIGLLLATESFYRFLPESMVKEGLNTEEITRERQLEKRLKELVEEGERRGGRGIGAIMICTKQGGTENGGI